MGSTSMDVDAEQIKLRALTLMGWMHEKQNLGVEMIRIARDGTVKLGERQVLARRIFKRTPWLKY